MRKSNRRIALRLRRSAPRRDRVRRRAEGSGGHLLAPRGPRREQGVRRRPGHLRFEEGRVEGTDGRNRFGAAYVATATTLKVEPKAASTRMACPAEVEAQATAFSAALSRAPVTASREAAFS